MTTKHLTIEEIGSFVKHADKHFLGEKERLLYGIPESLTARIAKQYLELYAKCVQLEGENQRLREALANQNSRGINEPEVTHQRK